MHRSRLSLLVVLAGIAACSTRDDFDGTKSLSQDSALVAELGAHQKTQNTPLPDACGTVAMPAQPSAANKPRAQELIRQAHQAEILGNVKEASALLRRASELDGTDRSAAYHLGRTSEASGDSAAALTAYCRYLAMAPTTTESGEVRQRVAELSRSQSAGRPSAGSVGHSLAATRPSRAAATVRRPAPPERIVESRAPRTTVGRAVRAVASARNIPSANAAAGPAAATGERVELPVPRDTVRTAPSTDGRGTSAESRGDV